MGLLPIHDEAWREYDLEDGTVYRIEQPTDLLVRESGAHNVVDINNVVHYIPNTFKIIRWKTFSDKKPIRF